jgi:acyl dehydratase
MLEVEQPADMKAHIGKQVGTSEWVLVDQGMIDKFAEATGDHQWTWTGHGGKCRAARRSRTVI